MKILQLTNKLPFPAKDGGSIAMLSLAKSLAQNGAKVIVLAMNTAKHYTDPKLLPKLIDPNIQYHVSFVRARIGIVGALKNLLFSKLPFHVDRFYSKDFEHRLIALLKEEKPDFVQLEGLYCSAYIKAIRENSDAQIAYRAHNLEHEIWERLAKNEKSLIKKKYLKILSKRLYKYQKFMLDAYDFVIPITERDHKALIQFGLKKPAVIIPGGVDMHEDHIAKNINPDSIPKFFHIGALDWQPNMEGLIWFFHNVWPSLLLKYPLLGFHLAGRNAPKSLIRELEKVPNLYYYGEVEDAQKFMNKFEVLVVPLWSGSGMRIKIIEGMAAGKIVLSTSIGAEGINAENGKAFLISDNVEGFVRNSLDIIESQSVRMNMPNEAIDFVRNHFSNDVLGKRLSDFYRSNLKGGVN